MVEIKGLGRHGPAVEAQALTCLVTTGKKVGLLLNFNSTLLKNGVKRFILWILGASGSPRPIRCK